MSSLLVSKKSSSRVVSVRLPSGLVDELDKLRADARRVGLAVDISSVITDSLSRAIRQARAELARHAQHDALGGHGEG
jgi:Arc/MetJ-type ribon-helix-helix transcriptional regulator